MEMQAAVKEIEGADKNTDSRSSILECPGGPGDSKDTIQYHQQPVLWPWHGKERNEKKERGWVGQRTQFNKRHIMPSSRVSAEAPRVACR